MARKRPPLDKSPIHGRELWLPAITQPLRAFG